MFRNPIVTAVRIAFGREREREMGMGKCKFESLIGESVGIVSLRGSGGKPRDQRQCLRVQLMKPLIIHAGHRHVAKCRTAGYRECKMDRMTGNQKVKGIEVDSRANLIPGMGPNGTLLYRSSFTLDKFTCCISSPTDMGSRSSVGDNEKIVQRG